MINRWISNLFSPSISKVDEQTLELTQQENEHFTKALQFYIYTRHMPLNNLSEELADRLSHAGHVAYSMIITFLKEREFKPDYMHYLNDELKMLYDLFPELRQELDIQPEELGDIELNEQLTLNFQDEESDLSYRLAYQKKKGLVTITTYK
jgi:hypothetical protein